MPTRLPAPGSELEETLALHLRADGLVAGMEREFQPHDVRKWRFDFAWPELRIAVECEGGIFTSGRHTRGRGFIADTHKYNWAAEHGWRVFRYTEQDIHNGNAVAQIQRVLRGGAHGD